MGGELRNGRWYPPRRLHRALRKQHCPLGDGLGADSAKKKDTKAKPGVSPENVNKWIATGANAASTGWNFGMKVRNDLINASIPPQAWNSINKANQKSPPPRRLPPKKDKDKESSTKKYLIYGGIAALALFAFYMMKKKG